jgi:hypothetical protein
MLVQNRACNSLFRLLQSVIASLVFSTLVCGSSLGGSTPSAGGAELYFVDLKGGATIPTNPPDAGVRRAIWEGYHENSIHSRNVNDCRCRHWCRSDPRTSRSSQAESLSGHGTATKIVEMTSAGSSPLSPGTE